MLTVAANDWDDFARIRRGEKKRPEQPAKPDTAPAQPKPKPKPKAIPEPAVAAQPQTAVTADSVRPLERARANPRLVSMPRKPVRSGPSWAFYRGTMDVDKSNWLDPHGKAYSWTYAHATPLAKDARIVVFLHGSGDGERAMWPHDQSPRGEIEIRVQDAEVHDTAWREWWSFGADGVAYPGRRIAAALAFVSDRHDVDSTRRGIVIEGASMGGGGAVVQTMILPPPWRARIAYVTGHMGVLMPRRVARKNPDQFASLPAMGPGGKAVWESIDFALQAASDPIVRGMHYRQSFSTSDPLNVGLRGNTQLEFVNIVENNSIGGAFSWVDGGRWMEEEGVTIPDLADFETAEQDITLDRAHPAFTRSTGNFPLRQTERLDVKRYPRGHYNLGLQWRHAETVDSTSELVFPLRYLHHTGLGKGVPDQPRRVRVNVTPRRPQQFTLQDGETLRWSWDNGAMSGSVQVDGDTATIEKIPLVSGEPYKKLRIYRE